MLKIPATQNKRILFWPSTGTMLKIFFDHSQFFSISSSNQTKIDDIFNDNFKNVELIHSILITVTCSVYGQL